MGSRSGTFDTHLLEVPPCPMLPHGAGEDSPLGATVLDRFIHVGLDPVTTLSEIDAAADGVPREGRDRGLIFQTPDYGLRTFPEGSLVAAGREQKVRLRAEAKYRIGVPVRDRGDVSIGVAAREKGEQTRRHQRRARPAAHSPAAPSIPFGRGNRPAPDTPVGGVWESLRASGAVIASIHGVGWRGYPSGVGLRIPISALSIPTSDTRKACCHAFAPRTSLRRAWGPQVRRRLRSRRRMRAAFLPDAPMIPPPGCVLAPVR